MPLRDSAVARFGDKDLIEVKPAYEVENIEVTEGRHTDCLPFLQSTSRKRKTHLLKHTIAACLPRASLFIDATYFLKLSTKLGL